MFEPHDVRDAAAAAACRAGLWLYHDFLDESHTISQEIETPEGSYWHALFESFLAARERAVNPLDELTLAATTERS